jgi:hypothetical protein
MGITAIACYRPYSGNGRKLLSAVRKNTPLLLSQNLITDRPPTLMKSDDDILPEITKASGAIRTGYGRGYRPLRGVLDAGPDRRRAGHEGVYIASHDAAPERQYIGRRLENAVGLAIPLPVL